MFWSRFEADDESDEPLDDDDDVWLSEKYGLLLVIDDDLDRDELIVRDDIEGLDWCSSSSD